MARNKYPEETRNLIIDTASRLFVEKGYEQTSIQDIINNLGGLSKGAIYHHFKSKEEIMNAVADKLYAGATDSMYAITRRKDLNGLEKLRMIFQASIYSSAQEELFAAAPDMLNNPQLLALYLRNSVQQEAPAMIQPILEEGIADGSIRTDYPREMAEVLMLIGNLWLNPLVYHSDAGELIRKMKFFQHMLRGFGLDIIDDAMFVPLERYAALYQENRDRR
nr:TetR/AcrR family transcriptional regulator [uncultured Eisenbergiella sp.]